jgi:hypothetical protein
VGAPKILSLLEIYERGFHASGFSRERFPVDEKVSQRDDRDHDRKLNHCFWMIGEIRTFVVEERLEKAMRWLGFLQGVLWAQGQMTIGSLAEHNRAD